MSLHVSTQPGGLTATSGTNWVATSVM